MELLLVCGPWGSGTTALAGLLAEIGVGGDEPYFRTNDPRTPNSYESIAFKQVVRLAASEERLAVDPARLPALHGALVGLRARLAPRLPVFLKDCLASLLIEPISAVFDTGVLFVVRPLDEIEAARRRRGWHARYGVEGAGAIYAAMFNALVRGRFPVLVVRYEELCADPGATADRVARFAGLAPPADPASLAFVRRAGPQG